MKILVEAKKPVRILCMGAVMMGGDEREAEFKSLPKEIINAKKQGYINYKIIGEDETPEPEEISVPVKEEPEHECEICTDKSEHIDEPEVNDSESEEDESDEEDETGTSDDVKEEETEEEELPDDEDEEDDGVDEEDDDESPEFTKKGLVDMGKDELQDMCVKRELSKYGTKPLLADRILEYEQKNK